VTVDTPAQTVESIRRRGSTSYFNPIEKVECGKRYCGRISRWQLGELHACAYHVAWALAELIPPGERHGIIAGRYRARYRTGR